MKIDLIELLKTRTIMHPTIVTSAELRDGNLRLLLAGYSWWHDTPAEGGPAYEFLFQGVSGNIDIAITTPDSFGELWDEALDDFSVQPIAGADWAKPRACDIYCSQPLKNALALYVRLESYLLSIGSHFPPQHFLNCGDSDRAPLSWFARITASNSFLLASAPQGIADLLVEELEQQGVKHNILRKNPMVEDPGLHVRVGGSEFLCHSAVAILPD